MRTYEQLLSDDNFSWISMDNRSTEDSYAKIPEMLSQIPTSYGNHLEQVLQIPKKTWIKEYQNYVPRKYRSNQIKFPESSESDEDQGRETYYMSALTDNAKYYMEESITMEEQFICDALFASEIEVRRNKGLKDPADWCMDEETNASISFPHYQLHSSTNSSQHQLPSSCNHQLHSSTSSSQHQLPSSCNHQLHSSTSSQHQLPSSSTISNHQHHSSTSSHHQLQSSYQHLSSSTSSEQYPIIFEQRSLTNSTSDVGLLCEDKHLNASDIANFDAEYMESAAPVVVLEDLDQNVGAPSTNPTKKLNSYARQSLGVDQWDWDGFEIVFVQGKGLCVRATRDLFPGYRFPYGGVIISIEEGLMYRRNPNTLFGRGLHEYLVAYHREWTKERSGKKFNQRCYLDGHPRHLEMEGGLSFAWPGIYCSQADEYKEVNAELAELSTRHQPPHYEHVDPSIKMFVVVKKIIKAGELVEIDYRMSKKTQIRKGFGPAYQELSRRKNAEKRSHKPKMFRTMSSKKRKPTTYESDAHESDKVLTTNSSSNKCRRRQVRNPSALEKQNTDKKNQNNEKNHPLESIQQQIFEHPREESLAEQHNRKTTRSFAPFAITKWLEGTEFIPNHKQRERMRNQYPSLAEDLRSAQKKVARAKKDKAEEKEDDDDDEHHQASKGGRNKK